MHEFIDDCWVLLYRRLGEIPLFLELFYACKMHKFTIPAATGFVVLTGAGSFQAV